jgi:hypothetical protein
MLLPLEVEERETNQMLLFPSLNLFKNPKHDDWNMELGNRISKENMLFVV